MRAKVTVPERERVYKQLLHDVVENRLPSGARLVEAKVAMRSGVSRTPVREALLRLEREGFVVGELHRGFRVTALDEQAAREIFPMVGALQGLAISESGPLLASRLDALRLANERLRKNKSKPLKAMAADSEFHRILVSLCPNTRLLELIESLHHQLLRYEHMFMSDFGLIDSSIAQHAEIIANIAAGDTAGAERAVRANYASGLAAVISKLRALRQA